MCETLVKNKHIRAYSHKQGFPIKTKARVFAKNNDENIGFITAFVRYFVENPRFIGVAIFGLSVAFPVSKSRKTGKFE